MNTEIVDKTKIELRDVSIEFPGVKALQNIDCCFESGKSIAVVGANGAGKSTMMKILAGANPTYTGKVLFGGNVVELRVPQDAEQLGIAIVYQEVDAALVPSLSVAENIMTDYFVYHTKGKLFVDWKFIFSSAKEALKRLNIDLDPHTLVSDLTLAQKQMVLIAKAIHSNCKFLILDEPTAPLSDKETKDLFEIVEQLKADGVGIIFISHRLNELFEICDEIIVMRDGRVIETFPIDETVTTNHIVSLMLGDAKIAELDKSDIKIGKEILKVSGLTDSENRIHDVNLTLREGEIIGISGLVGAGKTEFCKTLFGAYGKANGTVEIKGERQAIRSPYQATRAGMALIPEERRKEGVVISESVCSNLSLVTLGDLSDALSFIHKKKEAAVAEQKVKELHIKTPLIRQQVMLLSGGNQQKVTIGKWLDSSADIYIFDEPTKGIDVGAKNEVYRLIIELARSGKSVIYASSEQSEILTLTDRVYVFYSGTVQKELVTCETTEKELLYYATGGK